LGTCRLGNVTVFSVSPACGIPSATFVLKAWRAVAPIMPSTPTHSAIAGFLFLMEPIRPMRTALVYWKGSIFPDSEFIGSGETILSFFWRRECRISRSAREGLGRIALRTHLSCRARSGFRDRLRRNWGEGYIPKSRGERHPLFRGNFSLGRDRPVSDPDAPGKRGNFDLWHEGLFFVSFFSEQYRRHSPSSQSLIARTIYLKANLLPDMEEKWRRRYS
jgi:hypothetical protein